MTENHWHELATPEEWSRARQRETVLRSLVTPVLFVRDRHPNSQQADGSKAGLFLQTVRRVQALPPDVNAASPCRWSAVRLASTSCRDGIPCSQMHQRVLHVGRAAVIRCIDAQDRSRMPTSRSADSELSDDQTEACRVRSEGACESPVRDEGSRGGVPTSSRKYSADTSLPASSNRSQSNGPDRSR
jgi:hypothetical protein